MVPLPTEHTSGDVSAGPPGKCPGSKFPKSIKSESRAWSLGILVVTVSMRCLYGLELGPLGPGMV